MFTQYRSDLKAKAQRLRREMTPMEKKLWFEFLRSHPRWKFLRQKPIGSYIVDFYCAEKRLVIEVDGDSHFLDREAIARDLKRTEFLQREHQTKSSGLRTRRWWEIFMGFVKWLRGFWVSKSPVIRLRRMPPSFAKRASLLWKRRWHAEGVTEDFLQQLLKLLNRIPISHPRDVVRNQNC